VADFELPLPPAVLPDTIAPMLPGGTSEPFDSPDYVFEVRWDGVRALAFVEAGSYHLQDQSGRNISELFPELSELLRCVESDQVILDGMVVVSDDEGRPDFAALDRRMRIANADGVEKAAKRQPAAYVAFDVLYVQARSVMSMSLLRRRKALKELVHPQGRVCLSDAVAAEGVSFFEAARDMGIDAVIAKRKDSPYLAAGRSPGWLLVQDVPRQDVVVLGFIPQAVDGGFESLLVGVFPASSDGMAPRPVYAGAVGGGFDRGTERLLAQALPGLRVGAERPDGAQRVPPEAVWVRPELVVSVKFSEWSGEGTLRFPIFLGLHPEVDPRECVRKPLLPPRVADRKKKLKIELPQLPFAAED
jgi:ATP-dependent DNA ligase